MLRELHISNLAVIADARIELHPRLNCFTGATGAGKSLVIGAIELLLGLRQGADMLRPGVDEARISGLFEIHSPVLLRRIQEATDVEVVADGGEILLTRRLYASGRSSANLNGNPITLAMLKQVADSLVDVHGQHDHQYLLKPANQLEVLNQFGELERLRDSYGEVFQKVVSTQRRIDELAAGRTLRVQQLELYRFQAAEIDAANLQPAEYEELVARSSMLQNLEKLRKDVAATYGALYEADGAVLDRLKMMGAVLSELAMLDQNLRPTAEHLRDATLQLEDAAFDLSRYQDKLDLDPSELAEVADRLNHIQRTLNKYGDPLQATIDYRREIGEMILQLESATDDHVGLQSQLQPLAAEAKRLGQELTRQRQAVAKKLSKLIESGLADLGMEKAEFSIAVTPAMGTMTLPGMGAATSSGFDQVEFWARTNPGQLSQPLRKIASGGELSRIMLALKGILAQGDRISVLVFDEIDSNVGGRLGSVIGTRLRELSAHHQVLCITHLPQIATYADRHLTVRKSVVDGQTQTVVREMTGDERLQELAEMIGGKHVTDTTRSQVVELLEAARQGAGEVKSVASAAKTKRRPSETSVPPAPPAAEQAPARRSRVKS